MEPVIVEVSCNLDKDHPKWNEIESVYIEIGYPSIQRKTTTWKHTGWLKDIAIPFSKLFSHALWSQRFPNHTLSIDFYPVMQEGSGELVDQFYLKRHILDRNGHTTSSKSMLVRGDFSDEMFTLKAIFPKNDH
jgi:hypothetical protein